MADLIVRKVTTEQKWELAYLAQAAEEGHKELDEDQYAHMVQQFEELALEDDPTHPKTADVEKIFEFYELRDKGGILGKKNIRVYFMVNKDGRRIIVLCTYKKEDESAVGAHIVTRVRNRMRQVQRMMK